MNFAIAFYKFCAITIIVGITAVAVLLGAQLSTLIGNEYLGMDKTETVNTIRTVVVVITSLIGLPFIFLGVRRIIKEKVIM